ncbi:MAG: hypothetical protein J0I66_09140 [Microbacterium sp.]|nr:hypothetical protein [Microbacterium sp.]
MVADRWLGAVGAALIGVVCIVVYIGVLALLRAPELGPALQAVRRLVRR